jgi:hypothetical protein
MKQAFMACERKMQPVGLLSCMKRAWTSKKQFIRYTEDYKNEKII